MNFLKTRKARKELKEVLHYARHIRHMHEDIADPKALEQLRTGEQVARAVRKSGAGELMETAGEAVIEACEKVAPPKKHAKICENVEVLFVAVAAAMAIRAYFFQPFKIPTGSMQPLYTVSLLKRSRPSKATIRLSQLRIWFYLARTIKLYGQKKAGLYERVIMERN
jgi:signal peptidase I